MGVSVSRISRSGEVVALTPALPDDVEGLRSGHRSRKAHAYKQQLSTKWHVCRKGLAKRGGAVPRRPLIRSHVFPYHITARANNKEAFPFELASFWPILTDASFESGMAFGSRIHALVLMPNHIHMLLSTPSEDLGIVMREYMRSITRRMNIRAGRSGRIFGGSYYWSLIDSKIYFAHAYKYVYRNPVRAGLCTKVEEYDFSTVEKLPPQTRQPFPLWYPFDDTEFTLIPQDYAERSIWLNTPFKSEHEEQVRKALRKTRFVPPKEGWKNTLAELWKPVLL